MKANKTTLSGAFAAGCLAATQVPDLPPWLGVCFRLGAAIGVASLGWHATDCPANCPGSDDQGRRLPLPERWPSLLLSFALLVPLGAVLLGCTAPNPAAGPAAPDQPAYVVSPALAKWSNSVVGIAQQAGPLTPAGPALPEAAAAVFALVGAISAAVARSKSTQAAALARAVARAGVPTVQTVLDATHPADNAATLRQTLNRALAAVATAQAPPAAPPPSSPGVAPTNPGPTG